MMAGHSINRAGVFFFCFAWLSLGAYADNKEINKIEVFTIAEIKVTHVPDAANVVELDQAARLDKRLSQGLPGNKAAAISVVKKRLDNFKEDYGAAYRGLIHAWRLGVKKVPAVVVNATYVVYGQRNVAKALTAIRQARRKEHTP